MKLGTLLLALEMGFAPHRAGLASIEGDDDGGGGGGSDPADDAGGDGGAKGGKGSKSDPTFTKDDVDRIVKAALAKRDRSDGRAKGELEAARAREAELSRELEELRASIDDAKDSGDPKRELAALRRDLAKLQREHAQAVKDRDEAVKGRDDLAGKIKRSSIESAIRGALSKSGAHTQGLEQAVRLLSMEGSAEVDEDGVVTLTIGGMAYDGDSLAKAAQAWLAANPHFARAVDGGSNGRRPGSARVDVDLDKLSPAELIRRGLES